MSTSTAPACPAAPTCPTDATRAAAPTRPADPTFLADALRHPVHLAVTGGPGTGGCLGVPATGLVVGRESPWENASHTATSGARRPPLADPLLSRDHFEVRAVPTRGSYVLRVRDLGSTNGVWVRKPRRAAADGTPRWRRRRRVGRRWRTVPLGTLVGAGATRFEMRARPGEILADETPRFGGPVPAVRQHDQTARGKRRLDVLLRVLPMLMMAAMTVPLLAMRGSSPWRWLLLALPLVILVVAVASAVPRGSQPDAERPLDAAALGLAVARGHRGDEVPSTLPWHLPNRSALRLSDGETIGVHGPRANDAAAWLALRAWFACPPGTCQIVRDDASPDLAAGGLDRGVAGWRIRISGGPPSSSFATHPRAPIADAASHSREVLIVVARHRLGLPASCTHVVAAPQEADEIPAESWTAQVLELADEARSDAGIIAPLAHLGEFLDRALVDGLHAGGPRAAGAVRRAWRDGALRPSGMAADGTPAAPALRSAYAGRPGNLGVVLGEGPAGTCAVDLIADGPHALVAGTTGSGKSEALVSWVLQLALTHDPRELQLFLLDHKGGATFGEFAALPHTAGLLTDLDASTTDRALRSLTAEVARRERLLADAGVRDLRDLEEAGLPGPPRLLVIGDEFRVLADAHPDLMDGLRRLAAQGRTLGIHLVLATQRPAGALSADLRANIPLRLCLRVVEPADSTDVLGVAHAAELPPVPGLAYLRAGALQPLRVAWAGDGTLSRAAVNACREAWSGLVHGGAKAPSRPWAPPLPALLRPQDLASYEEGHRLNTPPDASQSLDAPQSPRTPGVASPPTRASALLLGLADLPNEQRLAPISMDPNGGVLVVGDRGSGRTAAVRALLGAALANGWCTHLLTAGTLDADSVPPLASRRGTWLDARDAARARSLIEAILDGCSPAPTMVAIDDAEAVADLLDTGRAPGTGIELLERLVRDAPRVGACVVAAGSPALATPRWTAPLSNRLVLAVRDATQAGLVGVPAQLRNPGAPPGRAVLLTHGSARSVQITLHSSGPAGPATPETPAELGNSTVMPTPEAANCAQSSMTRGDYLDIPPLPKTLSITDFFHTIACTNPNPENALHDGKFRSAFSSPLAGSWAAAGCDGHGPILAPLDAACPWVITGPPGSGRSTLLRALTYWLIQHRIPHVEVEAHTLHAPVPSLNLPDATAGGVVLVDDADAVALTRLSELCTPQTNIACVAVAPEHAVGVHASGLPARALAVGTVIATDPRRSALPEIRNAADPHHQRHAVLLHRGRARRFVPPTFSSSSSTLPEMRANPHTHTSRTNAEAPSGTIH